MIKFTTHILQHLLIVWYGLLKFKTIACEILEYWTYSLRLSLLNQFRARNSCHSWYFLIRHLELLFIYYIFFFLYFWWRRRWWLTRFHFLILTCLFLFIHNISLLFLRLISNNYVDHTCLMFILFNHIYNHFLLLFIAFLYIVLSGFFSLFHLSEKIIFVLILLSQQILL